MREHPDLPGACGSSASEPGSCPRPCRSSPSAAHRRGRHWSTRERPPSSCRRQLKQCLKLSVKVAPSPIGPFAIERAVRRTVRSSSRSCQSPCCWERNDPGSPTKPKVTGSNPVGRALRRWWIPLNGANSCGAGEICLSRSKPLFLSSSRIGLSLKQARGLVRDMKYSLGRLGAVPYPKSLRFGSGPVSALATTSFAGRHRMPFTVDSTNEDRVGWW